MAEFKGFKGIVAFFLIAMLALVIIIFVLNVLILLIPVAIFAAVILWLLSLFHKKTKKQGIRVYFKRL